MSVLAGLILYVSWWTFMQSTHESHDPYELCDLRGTDFECMYRLMYVDNIYPSWRTINTVVDILCDVKDSESVDMLRSWGLTTRVCMDAVGRLRRPELHLLIDGPLPE